MIPTTRLKLDDALWIRGEAIDKTQRNARTETRMLRERGVAVCLLKNSTDPAELEEIRKLVFQSDRHVILSRLGGKELNALRPIFEQRRNFSLVVDDWWSMPGWFNRHADYLFFRNYNGMIVRAGLEPLVPAGAGVPWFCAPEKMAWYPVACSLLRAPALLASPFWNALKSVQRRSDQRDPKTMIYFPFPIAPEDVPLGTEKLEHDFSNLGGTCGYWVMRDAHSPAELTFANLYYDRKRLIELIGQFEGNPFTVFDWRRNGRFLPFDEYARELRKSRFTVATGGYHLASIPKYLEYICLGTPIIGAGLPYEYPWLDECMVSVDIMRTIPAQLKPQLHTALDQYGKIREKCLAWREKLFQLYDIHRLLEVAQMQIDGQPVPPGYLKNLPAGAPGG